MTTLTLVPQSTAHPSAARRTCPVSWCVKHRVDPDTRTVTHRGDVGQPIEGTDMTASLFRVDEPGRVGETFIDWRGPKGDIQMSLDHARRFVNRTVYLTHSVEPVDLGDVLRDFRGGAA